MKKWWLLQHIADPNKIWMPVRLITIFGIPLCFFAFRAWGPFDTEEDAKIAAEWSAKRGGIDPY